MRNLARNALGSLNIAREYFEAVEVLNVGERFRGPSTLRPMLQLLGIGLENCMKADLSFRGTEEEGLKDIGHSLTSLLGKISPNLRTRAEKLANRLYIEKLREYRDDHLRNLPSILQEHTDVATNFEIGNSVPRLQDLIDRFGPQYRSDRGYRYHETRFDGSLILSFAPYSDIPTLYLTIWGCAFADVLEDELRTASASTSVP